MVSNNRKLCRRLMPIQLTMTKLATETMPTMIDNILGNPYTQSHSTIMVTTGSAFNILAIEPNSPSEIAVAHAT